MQEEAAQHAAEVFGLAGIDATKVKEFVSYDDRNFYLPAVTYSHPETKQTEVLDVIFKVHNGVESDNDGLIRAHNEVLAYLKNEGVMVPEPLPVRQGGDTIGWITLKRIRNEADSRKHAVRLLRYIPGVLIDQNEEEKPEMLRDLGRFVGRMDNKLLKLAMPKGLQGRVLLWDLKNLPALARFSDCIVDPDNRALQIKVVSTRTAACAVHALWASACCPPLRHGEAPDGEASWQVLARFNELVAPKLGSLRKAGKLPRSSCCGPPLARVSAILTETRGVKQ